MRHKRTAGRSLLKREYITLFQIALVARLMIHFGECESVACWGAAGALLRTAHMSYAVLTYTCATLMCIISIEMLYSYGTLRPTCGRAYSLQPTSVSEPLRPMSYKRVWRRTTTLPVLESALCTCCGRSTTQHFYGKRELLTSFLVRCLRKPLGSPALTRPGLPQVDYRTTISISSHDTTRSSYVRCLVAVRHSTSACK
jgi:hypothetical protein